MRLHRARGSAELREVASGSVTQGLWLRNGKVRSHVSGIDRSRCLGEVRRGGRRGRIASDGTKKSVQFSGLIWVKEKRESSAMSQSWPW